MSDSELRASLVAAILATPGVLRIEPTLVRSMRSFASDGVGGLTVVERAGATGPVTQVSVDLATRNGSPAREVAHHVRASIVACLQLAGREAGGVTVNVLSIEAEADIG